MMVYGHANGRDIAETAEEVAKYKELGYLADACPDRGFRACPPLMAWLRTSCTTSRRRKACRRKTSWSTEKYLLQVPKLFEALRLKFGDDLHLLHDVHHRLTPIEAARLGKSLEPYHLFWLEDAVTAELQEGFRILRQHTTIPLAVGEVFNSIWDAHILIQEQLIDYLRMTVVHGGGLTHLKKIAALAEIYHVRTGCHGATDLSPVAMAAALHFDISVNNFGIQEYMRHTRETDEVFPHSYSFKSGYLHPGDTPGLGVDYDEKLAEKFPYERAYLPVNRKLDGTMFNW